ncbi:hypothetical protein D3C74_36110 [compost metagenome]
MTFISPYVQIKRKNLLCGVLMYIELYIPLRSDKTPFFTTKNPCYIKVFQAWPCAVLH